MNKKPLKIKRNYHEIEEWAKNSETRNITHLKEARIEDRDYPKDTIGYHFRLSSIVFGEESPATLYLQKKANESPNGFDELVVLPESQVLYILGQLHLDKNSGEL